MEEDYSKTKKNSFFDKIKNIEWQDWVFIGVLLFVFLYFFCLFSQYKGLPSPIYGGDYYFFLGNSYHIYEGNSFFTDPQIIGEYVSYPPLPYFIIGNIARIFHLSVLKTTIFYPLFLLIIGIPLVYFLGIKLFKNKNYSLIFLIGWLYFFLGTLNPKFTNILVTIPLFFLAFTLFFFKKDLKTSFFLGVCYGLTALTHSSFHIGATFFLVAYFIYEILQNSILKENNKILIKKNIVIDNFKRLYKNYLIMFGIGIPIALLYWWAPIFIYHAKPLNPWMEFGVVDYSKYGISVAFNTIAMFFPKLEFSFNNFLSLLSFFGLCIIFFIKGSLKSLKLIKIYLVFLIPISLHYLITEPLFKINFAPWDLVGFFLKPLKLMLILVAIVFLVSIFKNKFKIKKYFIITFIIILIFFLFLKLNALPNGRWVKVALETNENMDLFDVFSLKLKDKPISKFNSILFQIGNWIRENTDKNAVFISTNEDSAAINGLSGRKLLVNRRTHTNLWMYVNDRYADTAVILYGNNMTKSLELLKRYNVSYLYWNREWISHEFRLDEKGNIVYFFDPLIVTEPSKYKNYWESYGVNYLEKKWYLDPSYNEKCQKFDVLIALPSKFDYKEPWNENLTKYLILEKTFLINGQEFSKIFKINLSGGKN